MEGDEATHELAGLRERERASPGADAEGRPPAHGFGLDAATDFMCGEIPAGS
jgi:hypothetical protein